MSILRFIAHSIHGLITLALLAVLVLHQEEIESISQRVISTEDLTFYYTDYITAINRLDGLLTRIECRAQ